MTSFKVGDHVTVAEHEQDTHPIYTPSFCGQISAIVPPVRDIAERYTVTPDLAHAAGLGVVSVTVFAEDLTHAEAAR